MRVSELENPCQLYCHCNSVTFCFRIIRPDENVDAEDSLIVIKDTELESQKDGLCLCNNVLSKPGSLGRERNFRIEKSPRRKYRKQRKRWRVWQAGCVDHACRFMPDCVFIWCSADTCCHAIAVEMYLILLHPFKSKADDDESLQ